MPSSRGPLFLARRTLALIPIVTTSCDRVGCDEVTFAVDGVATVCARRVSLASNTREICVHHHCNQLRKAGTRLPPQPCERLAGIAEEHIDFGRAEKLLIHDDVLLVI